jgi:hypothetical protein
MTPKYDVGDIIYIGFQKQNFMIVERFAPPNSALLPKYNLLSLDTGKYMLYFARDIDCNSCLVA